MLHKKHFSKEFRKR